MTSKSKSAGALMQHALKLYQAGQAVVKEGVNIEPEDAFFSTNVVLVRVIERFLDSVQVSWHENPAKQGWSNEHTVLIISYGQHISIPFPLRVLLEKGLDKKVKIKMLNQIIETATAELKKWSTETGYNDSAAKRASEALTAVEAGNAFIVPCSWSDCNYPGYNAVAEPAWGMISKDHPISKVTDWQILFPHSAQMPQGVLGEVMATKRVGWSSDPMKMKSRNTLSLLSFTTE